MKLKFLLIVLMTTQILISQNNSLKEINRNGYSITYPSELKLDESGRNGMELFLFTEKTNSSDDFIESINLIIQNLKNMNIDLNKFVEITEGQVRDNGKLISSERIATKGNQEYQKLVYELKMGDNVLKIFQYDFVKDEKAYILTFTSKSSEFDNYSKEMIKIMNTFKLE
jgi:hypothetical protein